MTEIRNLTRQELIERLKQLAESEPPKNLAIGELFGVVD
jgi:hypothetical protein